MIKEAIIIDGKAIAEEMLADLKEKISTQDMLLGKRPKLAIILVGNHSASKIYVNNKIKAAEKVGILTELKTFDLNISQKTLLDVINRLNKDTSVSGIIVQMPLPPHISRSEVVISIDPKKDVDGFHPFNLGMLYSPYKHAFVPCTALGCLKLIESCGIQDLTGKNIVIIGRSNIVGRPLAALLLKKDCTVQICHSYTKNLAEITARADIVISAVGKPKFLTNDYFNSDAIVIDVGINRLESEGKIEIVGDVDFCNVKHKVKYITPVPGGVGPMTVAYLLINTYLAKKLYSHDN